MAFGLIQTHNLLIFYYAKEDIVTFTIIKSLRGVNDECSQTCKHFIRC